MTNPLESYPLYLKPKDIMDATQYGKTTVYEIIKELEQMNVPGMVVRRGERGIRIHRDKFFVHFLQREHMNVPEELRGA